MRSVGLLVALVLTTGCGPNTPTDQFDTRFNAEIDGPWSITTYGDTITLTIKSTPPWTGVAPVWSPESTAAFKWLGDGRLVSTMNVYSPQTVHITAALGPHLLSHDLVFRDVIASMGFFSKAGDSAVLVDTLRLTGVGDRQPFRVAPIDSGRTAVVSTPVYYSNIRDPQIIQMDGVCVRHALRADLGGCVVSEYRRFGPRDRAVTGATPAQQPASASATRP